MVDNTAEVFVTLHGCEDDVEDIEVALSHDPASDSYTFAGATCLDGEWATLEEFEETGWDWSDIEDAIAKQIGMRNPLYIGR